MKTITYVPCAAALLLTSPQWLQAESPVLPPQGNQTIPEFSTLLVTNTVVNLGLTGPLVYELDTNSTPSGAMIDTNGIITWTPGEIQGPSTNIIMTTVTDTNTLEFDTNSFEVVVTEVTNQFYSQARPMITSLQADGTLVWASPMAGLDTLEVCDDLVAGGWAPWAIDIPVTGLWNTNIVPTGGDAGMYRVSTSPQTTDSEVEYWLRFSRDKDDKDDGMEFRVFIPPNSSEYWFELGYAGMRTDKPWGDYISSFDSYHAWWEMYNASYADGWLDEGTGDKDSLSYNDRVSSIRVAAQDGYGYGQLTVYENSNGGGKEISFLIYKQPQNDDGTVFEMKGFGTVYWNDSISYIETYSQGNTQNYVWEFFKDSNFGGAKLTVHNDDTINDLGNPDTGLNDEITSFRFRITP